MLEKDSLDPERWYVDRIALEKVEVENRRVTASAFGEGPSGEEIESEAGKKGLFSAFKDKAKHFFGI